MNKFATFVVLALAAVALAHCAPPVADDLSADEIETQAALNTSDDEETEEVRKEKAMSVFADYCITSRDYVFTDIKQNANSASASAFSWIFSMSEGVIKQALKVNKDATEKLGKQLAQPETQVEGSGVVAEAQQKIAKQSQPAAFFSAVRANLAATGSALVNAVTLNAFGVKDMANPTNAISFLSQACEQVEEYEQTMRKIFEDYKEEMPEEARKKYEKTSFDSVPCVTSRRISRVNGFCRFVSVSFEPLKKVYGTLSYRSPVESTPTDEDEPNSQ